MLEWNRTVLIDRQFHTKAAWRNLELKLIDIAIMVGDVRSLPPQPRRNRQSRKQAFRAEQASDGLPPRFHTVSHQ
ncbi:hypothetical protein GVv1_21980 [Enterobacter pseudoroggenkampii]